MVGACGEDGTEWITKDSFRKKRKMGRHLEEDGRANCWESWKQESTEVQVDNKEVCKDKQRWRSLGKTTYRSKNVKSE